MNALNDKLAALLQQFGLSENLVMPLQYAGAVILILIIAIVIDRIFRRAIIPAIRKVTAKTGSTWDDYLLSDSVLENLCRLIIPISVYELIPFALPEGGILDLAMKLCQVYIIVAFVKLICAFISSLYEMFSGHEKTKDHSLKSFYQMLKLVVWCVGAIIIISTLLDKNPFAILTGLGAGTAILMLVFQDTIKGFVAGIQLMANDMLRPGDWITMPKYGADGDVIEVTLTTVKVQNWDKTITTVPPYALVNDSFQNWRGMFDTGGRRIKRSINIDMNTVRFCTQEEIDAFRKQPWMEGFEQSGTEPVNLYIFRHYMEYFLRHNPKVNQNMTMMVRQLQPTAQGMPIELYFFSADTAWVMYERLQGEVFDHLLAMLHIFDLKVFQSPTGLDIRNS